MLMQSSDIPDDALDAFSQRIFRYSAPLIKLYFDPPGVETLSVLGGSTLVSVGEIIGLLTAQHVAVELVEAPALGLVLREEEDGFHIPNEDFEIITIAEAEPDEIGPDLAFIHIKGKYRKEIERSKEFYPLNEHRDELLNRALPIDVGIWAICGPPHENIRPPEDSQQGRDYVIPMQLFCGFGPVEVDQTVRGYDYFQMPASYLPGLSIPKSTKGMSGGGLWQIPLTIHPDKRVTANRYLLSGVNFWRSGDDTGKIFAKSHGRRSVYSHAYDTILEKCA